MKLRFYAFPAIVIAAMLFAQPTNLKRQPNTRVPINNTVTGPALLDAWGNLFITLGALTKENSLRTSVRISIVQMAMFDAANAVLDGPYEPFESKPASPTGASAEAAVIRSAYVIASNEFPSQQVTLDAFYFGAIHSVEASQQAIDDGIAVGQLAADAVLDNRKNDKRNLPDAVGYTPGGGPGVWIPTPDGTTIPQTPFLQFVTPFGYEDPARFRPAPPPALDSKTYTNDYNESKAVGRKNDSSRTAEQSTTAQFWSPSASALWIANIRSLASGMDLLTAARFEAIGIAAVNNALISTWEAKYFYMSWRPVTAIRAGDSDGNDATEADPTWVPFITTPSHPEYPAAHTTVGASVLGFYTVWFGTDEFPLRFKGLNAVTRDYNNVNEIHAEEGNARVWGGMHFRNSTEVGTAVGSKVGKYTATHLLKLLD